MTTLRVESAITASTSRSSISRGHSGRIELTADEVADRARELRLVQLLSELEFFRASLEGLSPGRGTVEAIEVAVDLVQHLVAQVETAANPERDGVDLADLLAKAGEFITAAEETAGALRPGLARTLLGLFRKPDLGAGERAGRLRELADDLIGVARGAFALLGGGFATPEAAARWMEACGVFIGDLHQAFGRFAG